MPLHLKHASRLRNLPTPWSIRSMMRPEGLVITHKSKPVPADESQRDSGSKPKVARHELPWVNAHQSFPNPNGGMVLS
jgi:hypothetical protein